MLAFLKAGGRLLMPDSVYGPARETAEAVLSGFGVAVSFFAAADSARIEKRLRPETRLVMLEIPGSHSMDLIDAPAVTRVCRARGVVAAIDSTWSTPLYFKPLDFGADVIMHAATKFMAGRSDLLAGVLVANEEAWKTPLPLCVRLGGAASPDDAYVICRGLHTMAARVERGARSPALVAAWLRRRPQVKQVLWPALEGAPGHAIRKRDFTGATALFAVGMEDPGDLIADLAQAFAAL